MPILVLALAQSTWTTLVALAVRTTSLTALGALLSAAPTQKMLEYDVKVGERTIILHFIDDLSKITIDIL